jgi:hypothetical protein
MLTKRSVIGLLAGANLLLFAVLVSATYSLPAAKAQVQSANPGNFITVTAKAEAQNYDVVYLLDRQDGKLHAFYPQRRGGDRYSYGYGRFRDLKADFQR